MRRAFAVVVIVAFALAGHVANADVIEFDFSSNDGAALLVTSPNLISFPPDSPGARDFTVTIASAPALVGRQGTIDGTFTISNYQVLGKLETADISGTGKFTLYDAASKPLSADLVWNNVFVYSSTVGGLNTNPDVNLSGWTYSGNDPLFQSIANGATVTLSFQFIPKETLSLLMASGGSTSYSGSVSAVPEPSIAVLLAGGAAGLVPFARRLRKNFAQVAKSFSRWAHFQGR